VKVIIKINYKYENNKSTLIGLMTRPLFLKKVLDNKQPTTPEIGIINQKIIKNESKK